MTNVPLEPGRRPKTDPLDAVFEDVAVAEARGQSHVRLKPERLLPLLEELRLLRRPPSAGDIPNVAGRTWAELSQVEQKAVLDWIVTTCLLFGTKLHTALRVATGFCEGMEFDYPGDSPG